MLTISYITCRKEPMIQWFFDSLHNECEGDYSGIQIVVCDFWSQELPYLGWTQEQATERSVSLAFLAHCPIQVVEPKPTPWAGKYRLTKNDYFCAASTRNTCVCYARGDYLVFVDDISVLLPGWLAAVREHMSKGQIVCGAFRKVLNLRVNGGRVVDFTDHPGGWDSRWKHGSDSGPVQCHANWLFGCSFGCPVERLLEVNGMYEACDSTGTGMEDCSLGIAFGNCGHALYYDRRMLTFESEERHHASEHKMLRVDKHRNGALATIKPGETDPFDKGHALVNMYMKANRFENYFGEEGLRGLRERILSGEPFPARVLPDADWYDGQPLKEL